jgi:hypothetical protein
MLTGTVGQFRTVLKVKEHWNPFVNLYQLIAATLVCPIYTDPAAASVLNGVTNHNPLVKKHNG